jgi:hypothetical protein
VQLAKKIHYYKFYLSDINLDIHDEQEGEQQEQQEQQEEQEQEVEQEEWDDRL